ncbi:response regulator [Spirosoma sp.]|uniref:response regulator n=1 Tax=Spirosoma sp. TaxID=1899569 RepID=UPI002603CDB8|nr:response regulator [Spirosoma sp.]MCX6214294.1 response regulator [Spirosoma sp.]
MGTKILVIDDEPDIEPLLLQRFWLTIREGIYQFRFARGGYEAISLIEAEPDYDVLLVDINMRDMDGLTLLSYLPDLLPNGRAVMVSAYGDMDNIRTAMNRGAFDFVCKPINFKDLELTVEKTARHVHQLRESARTKLAADLKTHFFDNITHEFRTPLTLILAPVERLLRQWSEHQGTQRDLIAIDRNARQLLRLINQLLDLAKLEVGHLQVNPQPGYLSEFIDQLVQAFVPIAEQRGITLTYQTDVSGMWLFDAEKVGQIGYNLLANAIKFTTRSATQKTGSTHVTVRLENGSPIRLSVSDTGIGIPTANLPHIFDRFYQVNSLVRPLEPGTGIGLSMVKELTVLMGGTVSVSSSTGTPTTPSGSTFVVDLPISPLSTEESVVDDSFSLRDWFPLRATEPDTEWGSVTPPEDAPLVVVVEDNDELRTFLAEELTNHYRVLTAASGERGWTMIQTELPDVVISDVMMPGMDGYALTQCIKTTPATDHIAVILLTAKAASDSRLAGLQQGADDYLTKPFVIEELVLRLRNLLARQQRLRTLYQQQLARPELPQPIETVQDGWLRTLFTVLDEHLDDSSFTVERLAECMALSSKTLLRKVQSLTQLSTNDLIRRYRLRKAVDLLRAGHGVSETAYMVGFDTPSYFGQCFKEIYQVTPKDFAISAKA